MSTSPAGHNFLDKQHPAMWRALTGLDLNDQGRAALALAEGIRSLPDVHARDQDSARAREHLTTEEFSVSS